MFQVRRYNFDDEVGRTSGGQENASTESSKALNLSELHRLARKRKEERLSLEANSTARAVAEATAARDLDGNDAETNIGRGKRGRENKRKHYQELTQPHNESSLSSAGQKQNRLNRRQRTAAYSKARRKSKSQQNGKRL